MKVLLTVQALKIYAGSEIHTMTLADEFVKRGHEVDVFAAYISNDYRTKYTNVKFIDITNVHDLSDTYDLVWAHHYPILDYCLFVGNVKSKRIIFNSLSSYMEVEKLPNYYDELSLILCNSIETAKAHNELIDFNNIKIFPNYAPKSYFDYKIRKRELKKIAVISNHIPDELFELEEIFKSNYYEIDYIGIQRKQEFIDDTFLLNYDLVISIGKTVDYCIALGIPVYCYDHFGGCGYFTTDNIETAKEYNFSGRMTNRKISSEQLYKEIVDGYNTNLNNLESFRSYAMENLCFEDNFTNIIDNLDSLKDTVITKSGNGLSRLYIDYFYQSMVHDFKLNTMISISNYNEMLSFIDEQREIINNFNKFQNLKFIEKIKRILKHNYNF